MNKNIRYVVITLMLLAWTSISCGMSSLPFLATKTPTATATFTPSPTPTPSSTPTSTPTQAFTPTPLPEATLETLDDGSTRFTDIKGGYSFVLPDGWLIVNFAVEDPQQALDDAQDANPDKALLLNSLQTAVKQNARMGAADFSPDHFTELSVPLLFTVLDETTSSMQLKDILDANMEMLPQVFNADVTSSEIQENPFGVSYGFLDVTIKLGSDNMSATVSERLLMFQTNDYTVLITFAALEELKNESLLDFNEMIDSIELLQP